jgi:hypothetical protein
MSYDLGFWHEDHLISAQEADVIYGQLCEGNDQIVKAYPVGYFLEEVAQRYPPIGAYADETVDDCPWNCGWAIGQGSVVVCIAWSRADELTPFLGELAGKHNLVCYNPQQRVVYLPPLLLAEDRALQETHFAQGETTPSRVGEVWPSWEEVEARRKSERDISPEASGE